MNNFHGIQQEFSVFAMHMMANIAAAGFSVFLYCDGLCCYIYSEAEAISSFPRRLGGLCYTRGTRPQSQHVRLPSLSGADLLTTFLTGRGFSDRT